MTPEGLSPNRAIRGGQIEDRVRTAYEAVIATQEPSPNGREARFGDRVRLADIRERLGEDVNRKELDEALVRLSRKDAHLEPEENQKRLTQADRDSAVRRGATDYHFIRLNRPPQSDENSEVLQEVPQVSTPERPDLIPTAAGESAQTPAQTRRETVAQFLESMQAGEITRGEELRRGVAGLDRAGLHEVAKQIGVDTRHNVSSRSVRQRVLDKLRGQLGIDTTPEDRRRDRLEELSHSELEDRVPPRMRDRYRRASKGSLITAILGDGEASPSDTSADRAVRDLEADFRDRDEPKVLKSFGQGSMGLVELVEGPSGRKGVRKRPNSDWFLTAEQQTDAETLGSEVARAMGVDAPPVYRKSHRTIYSDYIDDATPAWKADPEVVRRAVESPEGRGVALYTALVGDEDKNDNNWMIRNATGKPVVFDHALAFRHESWPGDEDGDLLPTLVRADDPFNAHWKVRVGDYGGDPADMRWGDDLPWSREELEDVKVKLTKLRPRFKRLKREAWFDQMMGRLDSMIKRSKPEKERNRDEPTAIPGTGPDSGPVSANDAGTPRRGRGRARTGEAGGPAGADQAAAPANQGEGAPQLTGAPGSGRDLSAVLADRSSPESKKLMKEARRWNAGHSQLGYSDLELEKEGELVLRELARQQGWDQRKPDMGSPEDLDDAIRAGGIELWRGDSGRIEPEIWGYGPDKGKPVPNFREDQSPVHFHRELRSGKETRYGTGVYGNGIYVTPSRETADSFGSGTYTPYDPDTGAGGYGPADPRSIQRMVLHPDAHVIDYDELMKVASRGRGIPPFVRDDPGRLAAALGYDVVRIPGNADNDDGRFRPGLGRRSAPTGHVYPDQYILLNRNAALFQDHDKFPLDVMPESETGRPAAASRELKQLFPQDYGPEQQLALIDGPEPLRRRLHEIFDLDHAGTGTQMRIEDESSIIYPDYNTGEPVAVIEGTVRNSNGEIVGSFRRKLDLGTGTVTNESFGLEPGFQRKGISTTFNDKQDQQLARLGFTRAIISPAFRGSYPAAQRGYTWRTDRPGAAGDVPMHISGAYLRATPKQRKQLEDWLERFSDPDQRNWPTPKEIADYGALGRSIMEPASWEGEKSLASGRPAMTTAQVEAPRLSSLDRFVEDLPTRVDSRLQRSRRMTSPTAPVTGAPDRIADILDADTGPEGRRIEELNVGDNYVIQNGTAWRSNGVTYVIEHDNSAEGFAQAVQMRDWLENFQRRLPPEAAKYQRSYTAVAGHNPFDEEWKRRYNLEDFESGASARDGDTIIWNAVEMLRHPNIVEMMAHELGHNAWTLGDQDLEAKSSAWTRAGDRDWATARRIRSFTPWGSKAGDIQFDRATDPDIGYSNGLTGYGTADMEEDYAEAVALYLQGVVGTGILPERRYIEPMWLIDIFPERAKILDQMFPDFARWIQRERLRVRALPVGERMRAVGF